MSVPSTDEIATRFLIQPSYEDSLSLSDIESFDQNYPGKDGGRNTETEVITSACHNEPQKL